MKIKNARPWGTVWRHFFAVTDSTVGAKSAKFLRAEFGLTEAKELHSIFERYQGAMSHQNYVL
jgi:hypothetical protein